LCFCDCKLLHRSLRLRLVGLIIIIVVDIGTEFLRQDAGDVARTMEDVQNLDAVGERAVEDQVLAETRDGEIAEIGSSGS
jgi:hypothetical protein